MNLFQRWFPAMSRKASSICRPRLRAQLALETLETRLVPTTPRFGIRPPPPHILLPEFVVPESQPVDSSHFHSLTAALGVFANPLPQGTNVVITIEPGSSPDSGTVSLTQSNSAVQVTIQGDPNVPAAILPREQIQLAGGHYTLTNLNLESLTLGTTPGDQSATRNLVSKCLINHLVENGILSTFKFNLITGSAQFNSLQQYEFPNINEESSSDTIVNNTFTGENNPLLTVNHCDDIFIDQNKFYGATTAVTIINCGEGPETECEFYNNSITTSGFGSTGVLILQVDDHGNGNVSINVHNNTIHTNGGTGLALMCQDGNSDQFDVIVQGNDFHNNAIGVSISGGGTSAGCGHVDLGGGTDDSDFPPSLGGNDFRGFTTRGTTSAAAAVLTNTASGAFAFAANNIFSPGISPALVVDDSIGGTATGTGQIVAAALGDAQGYVQGLYNDVLGRTGSMAELNAWVNVLNTQGQTAVANGILRSGESLGRIVDALYIRFLGRDSDDAGRASWVSALQHGASLESVEAGFLTSPEYLGHIDTEFVQSLYINLLGRTGSTSELAAWDSQIHTLGLAGIVNGFLTSQEYRADNVIADFDSFLHRPPSPAAINNFVGLPTDLLGIEAAILTSQECFNNI
jgi:hypothetical protein